MEKIKIGIIYGGKSAEYDVSVQTALSVSKAIDFERYDIFPIHITPAGEWIRASQLPKPPLNIEDLTIKKSEIDHISSGVEELTNLVENNLNELDVVFPLLHGPNGEDGTVQGLLELLDVPYVGNGVLSSATAMDKVFMKNIFRTLGLSQPKYLSYTYFDWKNTPSEAVYNEINTVLNFPCFVKPANLGSSVGISKCNSKEEIFKAFEEAFNYDRKIIVEEMIHGREVEIGILGNNEPKVSVAGEIISNSDFYNYEAKYTDESTSLIIPAQISPLEYSEIKSIALKAFTGLDCSGLARADFFIKANGEILINEINTMPGFTQYSMYTLLWECTDLPYKDLIRNLIDLSLERHKEKKRIKYNK